MKYLTKTQAAEYDRTPKERIVQALTAQREAASGASDVPLNALSEGLFNPYVSDSVRSVAEALFKQRMASKTPNLINAGDGQLYNPATGEWITAPAGASRELGLNPQTGVDANGNPVLLQLGKDGKAVQTQMPDGVTLSKDPIKLDAGTHFVILDPITRQQVGIIPKDLAGAETQKEIGTARGKATVDLPRVEQNAAQTLGVLSRMKAHKGRAGSTGFIEGMLPSRTSDQVDFQSLVDQTQGQAFLQAFETLKGGGQITETEGTKATEAISRLRNQRLSDADYLRAITDLEDVIKAGLASARQQAAGQGAPAADGWRDVGNGVRMRRLD